MSSAAIRSPQRRRVVLPRCRPARDRTISGALAVVLGCTGLGALLSPYLAPTNLVMIYLLGVVAVSLRLGRGPSILAAVLSVAAFDFCFVPPRWTFAVDDTQYLLTFLVMLLTGLVISTLTARVQFQAESARRRERRTAALYAISRELAATQSREQIARIAVRHVTAASDVRAVVLLPDPEKRQLSSLATRRRWFHAERPRRSRGQMGARTWANGRPGNGHAAGFAGHLLAAFHLARNGRRARRHSVRPGADRGSSSNSISWRRLPA